MQYIKTNFWASLSKQFLDLLLADGWDVLLWESGTVYPQSAALVEARGTITLVSEFPANPADIVRLTERSPESHEIAVPVFSVQVADAPMKIRRYGLGDPRWYRHQQFAIGGFVGDDRQLRRFSEMMYEWLGDGDKYLDVYDYASDGTNPPLLDPAQVVWAKVADDEMYTQLNPALRYHLAVEGTLEFLE